MLLEANVAAGRHQARAGLAAMLLVLVLPGCGESDRPGLLTTWRHIWQPATEGREPPPGLQGPFPNLGTVPARPDRPDTATRQALTDRLAAVRQDSRNPLAPTMRPEPIRPSGTAGDRAIPMEAPAPPRLAAAPRVPWEPTGLPPVAPAATPRPGTPSAPQRPAPTSQPAPSQPSPALPQMDTAPPPPPPAELLAPGAGPSPPPSRDLLGPARSP